MGVFAQITDVASRYIEGDGVLPSDITGSGGWVDLRINDVESELMGLVPSLDGTVLADLTSSRAGRVVSLVCDKVLDLYRNPMRARNLAQAMGGITSTTVASNGFGAMIDFTEEELNRVRLRTPRPRYGSAKMTPWKISTREAYPWPGF
jgi:hypothetical protein